MQIRKRLALVLLLFQGWALAQTTEPPTLSIEEARAQRARGKSLKTEAEARYEAEKAECQGKLIAIGCVGSAKDRHALAVREAEALERGGREAERELRRRELEEKEARRAAEAPARAAREQADAARYREKEGQRAAERERRQTEDLGKQDTRRSELAAERAAKLKKIEDKRQEEARHAARAPERAAKRAERERQHRERAKKIDERKQQYAETLKRREADEAAKKAVPPAATPAR
jgi:hypothetical protein